MKTSMQMNTNMIVRFLLHLISAIGKRVLAAVLLAGMIYVAGCQLEPKSEPPKYAPITAAIASAVSVLDTVNHERNIKLTILDNSENEDGFNLEREIGGGSFSIIATLPQNSDSSFDFLDQDLPYYTTYYYRVYAHNVLGGSYSGTKSATTHPLQLETLYAELLDDAHIEQAYPQVQFGADPQISIKGKYGADEKRTLLKFNLPDPKSYIDWSVNPVAKLRLTKEAADIAYEGLRIDTQFLTEDFNEHAVTWQVCPAGNGNTVWRDRIYSEDSYVDVDITDALNNWVPWGPFQNRGILLFSSGDNTQYCTFYSKEDTSPSALPPQMRIEFYW